GRLPFPVEEHHDVERAAGRPGAAFAEGDLFRGEGVGAAAGEADQAPDLTTGEHRDGQVTPRAPPGGLAAGHAAALEEGRPVRQLVEPEPVLQRCGPADVPQAPTT